MAVEFGASPVQPTATTIPDEYVTSRTEAASLGSGACSFHVNPSIDEKTCVVHDAGDVGPAVTKAVSTIWADPPLATPSVEGTNAMNPPPPGSWNTVGWKSEKAGATIRGKTPVTNRHPDGRLEAAEPVGLATESMAVGRAEGLAVPVAGVLVRPIGYK
jgi:hypothetical protein